MIIKNLFRVFAAAPLAAGCIVFAGCGGSGGGGVVVGPTPPPANGSIYLTDSSGGGDQVLVFPQSANGGPAPAQQIFGSATGLAIPLGIAVDTAGNIWVTNSAVSSITEYPAGSTGNQAPINTVQGSSTFLNSPVGIAFDSNNDVWVVNSASNSVVEYGPNPSGNVAPIKIISGSSTLLNNPQYITTDGNGYVYVTSLTNNSINIYAPGATGNVAPYVNFGGNCFTPDGIALDSSAHIYVSCDADYTVREYTALNGTSRPTQMRALGNGSNAPGLYNPSGIAVNSLGTLFVANSAVAGVLGYVTVYVPNFNNATPPGATIGGGQSSVIHPGGLALH